MTNVVVFLGIIGLVKIFDMIFSEILKSWASQNILSEEVNTILTNQEISIIIKTDDQINYCNRKGHDTVNYLRKLSKNSDDTALLKHKVYQIFNRE